jgi:hypothetical protein
MIQTHRCRDCGRVLEAFVEFVPGTPLLLLQRASQSQVETAKIRHADQCPGRHQPPARTATTEKPRTTLISKLSLAACCATRGPLSNPGRTHVAVEKLTSLFTATRCLQPPGAGSRRPALGDRAKALARQCKSPARESSARLPM